MGQDKVEQSAIDHTSIDELHVCDKLQVCTVYADISLLNYNTCTYCKTSKHMI